MAPLLDEDDERPTEAGSFEEVVPPATPPSVADEMFDDAVTASVDEDEMFDVDEPQAEPKPTATDPEEP
jgi:hypothetical protein